MGFLRRLLGNGSQDDDPVQAPAVDAATTDAEERARDLELLRDEQDRLDDLTRRQLRYADHAWQPPAQGGDRRADDADADAPTG
jgi:hypothetical protein